MSHTARSTEFKEDIRSAILEYRRDTSSEGAQDRVRISIAERFMIAQAADRLAAIGDVLRDRATATEIDSVIKDEWIQLAKVDVQTAHRVSTALKRIVEKGGSAELALRALHLIRELMENYMGIAFADSGYEAANHIIGSLSGSNHVAVDSVVEQLQSEKLKDKISERISQATYMRGEEIRKFDI